MNPAIEPTLLRSYFEKRLPTYVEMLSRMVAINSFSANPAGIDALGELTAAYFQELGFEAERRPSVHPIYGQHLILSRQGTSGRTIGLISHLDTVFPESEERQNAFHWRIEGDRLYGPGAVDIKGGTVLIYMMLQAIRRFAPALFDEVTWVVLLDAAEEADGEDFGQLCLQRLPAEQTLACLVFEGGKLNGEGARLVVARKGMAVFHVTVEGKAAHAGTSHAQGANAIVQLAQVIGQIAGLTDYERQITFNVGAVAGGTVVNRVPHFASATVEMRAFAEDVFEEGIARMMALAEQPPIATSANGYGCRVSIKLVRTMPPWNHNEATGRLFDIWREVGSTLGIVVHPEARGGLSDGNYLWSHLPTLDGLGASGNNAHCSERSPDESKDQEYASRGSFVPKATLNTLALLRLIG